MGLIVPQIEQFLDVVTVLRSATSMTYEEDGIWEPSEKLEDDAHALIDQYDEITFWEELTARLTERDMIEEHGERAVGAMRPDQRERAAAPIAKAYTHEFEEVGLDRLRIEE